MTVHRLWSHETMLAAEGSSAAEARAFVGQHLLDHDMPHLVDDLQLVVSELASNAVGHAQTPFTVILCAFDGTVVLEVSDGSPAEPSLVAAGSLDLTDRGVGIMQALSRDWGVLPRAAGGKSVWAEFDSMACPHAPLRRSARRATPPGSQTLGSHHRFGLRRGRTS